MSRLAFAVLASSAITWNPFMLFVEIVENTSLLTYCIRQSQFLIILLLVSFQDELCKTKSSSSFTVFISVVMLPYITELWMRYDLLIQLLDSFKCILLCPHPCG